MRTPAPRRIPLLLAALALAASATAQQRLSVPVGNDPRTTDTIKGLLGLPPQRELIPVSKGSHPDLRREVAIVMPDGLKIVADFSPPQAADAQVVILLHDVNGSRHSWDPLVRELVLAGYGVLAPDMRGHADSMESTSGSIVSAGLFNEKAKPNPWLKLAEDLGPMIEWLRKEQGVKDHRVSIVGAGIGAAIGVEALKLYPSQIDRAAFLSLYVIMKGLSPAVTLEGLTQFPILFLFAEQEVYAENRRAKFVALGTGRFEGRIMPGEIQQGTNMLHRGTIKELVTWLDRSRKSNAAEVAARPTPTPRPTALPTIPSPAGAAKQVVRRWKITRTPTPTPSPTPEPPARPA